MTTWPAQNHERWKQDEVLAGTATPGLAYEPGWVKARASIEATLDRFAAIREAEQKEIIRSVVEAQRRLHNRWYRRLWRYAQAVYWSWRYDL